MAMGPSRLLPLFLLAGAASTFPLQSLDVDQSTFDELNKTVPGRGLDSMATGLLMPHMQDIFRQAQYAIEVEKGDVVISAAFPDTTVDGSCSHKIEALHPKATGTLLSSSYLKFGVANVTWRGAAVFADAEVDAQLDVGMDVRVSVGKEIFHHHCTHLGRKTVGIDVLSDGQNGIGLTMTASNAHIAKVNGMWSLVFNFHATVVGNVVRWNVDKVHVDGCKIKILDIEIFSVCGMIESKIKDKVNALMATATEVEAPKLLKKLEDKINTAIGSVVVIPLRIPQQPTTLDIVV